MPGLIKPGRSSDATGFGTDGKVTTDLASVQDVPSSIALQGDGKIILVGRTSVENENFALARYNGNGTLDSGFGTGGIVTTDFAGATDEPFAVALQGDGNIVVAGLAENNAGSDFELARYIGGAGTSGGAGNGGGTGTSAATATTLGSSINPSSVGASIVFTATTSGTGPTGTVNFRDGLNSIPGCSAVALSGSGNARIASCTTASLGAGAHSVTAAYSGDVTNAASTSAALTQTVNKVASTTGIATSLTPTLAGSSVTFTATVSGSAPTGSVAFKDGSTSIGGCSAVGLTGSGNVRTALCATASLVAGTRSITAALPTHLAQAILASGTAFKSSIEECIALLHLKCADIGDGMVDARKSPLIGGKGQERDGVYRTVIAGVDRRTMTQQSMSERRAAVVAQRPQQRACSACDYAWWNGQLGWERGTNQIVRAWCNEG
jgi:uncharacterized delta-60 repeat protein